jgi:hypothetical protein
MSTVTTCDRVLKAHSFTPRDRWNSLCVCGLSIAAHELPAATLAEDVADAIERVKADHGRFHYQPGDPLGTGQPVITKERAAWPSTVSPFSRAL